MNEDLLELASQLLLQGVQRQIIESFPHIVRHRRTNMFLARNTGRGLPVKWVRTREEATEFPGFARAQQAVPHHVDLANVEITASVDTRPKDEDPLGASLASGAVGSEADETPNSPSDHPGERA